MRTAVRRIAVLACLVLGLLVVLSGPTTALPQTQPQLHPLGNFTVNQQARVAISGDRVDVRWVLDNAAQVTIADIGKAVYDHYAGN